VDLGLDVKERSGWAVLSVQGEVDVYTAPQFREQLIQLVCTQRRILKVLEITGLTKVFTIHDSVEAAVGDGQG